MNTGTNLAQQRIFEQLEKAGLAVSEAEARQLAEYLALMEDWNKVYNLTGITSGLVIASGMPGSPAPLPTSAIREPLR